MGGLIISRENAGGAKNYICSARNIKDIQSGQPSLIFRPSQMWGGQPPAAELGKYEKKPPAGGFFITAIEYLFYFLDYFRPFSTISLCRLMLSA